MSLVIKNIKIDWTWSGDNYAIQGYNIAITPINENPNTKTTITANVGLVNTYTFDKVTLDTSAQYTAWVQALYEGSDSDWVSTGNITVSDDGNSTIATSTQLNAVDGKFANYSTTTQMNSAIQQKADSITSTVDGKLTNYSTTTQMNTAIQQKADSITSTVSATYETKTNVDSKIAGITFKNIVNCTVSGNNITATGSTNAWDKGCCSNETLINGQYVEFTANETNLGRMIGLNTSDTTVSYTDINYAIYLQSDGHYSVYEEGSSPSGDLGTYSTGDIFRIAIESNKVIYYKNGELKYTSAVTPPYSMIVDMSFFNPNATIKNIKTGTMLSGLATRIASAESSITQQAGQIALKVSQTDLNTTNTNVNNLTTRVSSAEQKITPSAIVSTVRSDSSYVNDLGQKVSTNSVISSINQTAESIKINASKIDITGAVTFSSFDSATQSKISNGDNANTIINNNKGNWDDAKSKIDLWKHPTDTTKINGGNIMTGTVVADRIRGNLLQGVRIQQLGYDQWGDWVVYADMTTNANGGIITITDSDGYLNASLGSESGSYYNRGGTLMLYDRDANKSRLQAGILSTTGGGIIQVSDSGGTVRSKMDSGGFYGLGRRTMCTWTGYIGINQGVTISHNLGYAPIVQINGTLGNLELTFQHQNINMTTIYAWNNDWSGQIYFY